MSLKPPDGATLPSSSRVDVLFAAPLNLDWPEYASLVVADDWSPALDAAIDAIPDEGGDILIPRSSDIREFSQPLIPKAGLRILGQGAQQRWHEVSAPSRLRYTGTGHAVRFANAALTTLQSVELHNLQIDGLGLAGAVDGLHIDGTAGDNTKYVAGVLMRDVAFTGFPRYQMFLDGLIVDVTMDHCLFSNEGNAHDDVVRSQQTKALSIVTQITLDNCFFNQTAVDATKWVWRGPIEDIRFTSGTVETTGSGLWIPGGLTLVGTHVEGYGLIGIGYRRSGANPANFQPSYCAGFLDGIQVGDPAEPLAQAVGTVINGMVGGNTTDIRIVAGSSRANTILMSTGKATGSDAVIVDERLTTDGALELMDLRVAPAWREVGAAGQPAFQNSWVNYGAPLDTAAFCRRPTGNVCLKGTVKSGVGTAIFNLPSGYRPAKDRVFVTLGDLGVGRVEVRADGNVSYLSGGGGPPTLFCLDGIDFQP